MDIYELIKARKSIRGYEKKEVPKSLLTKILDAAHMAPSAANKQPWHFIAITDEQTKIKLKEVYPRDWFYTAPVVIIICGEPTKAWIRNDGVNFCDIDEAIAFDHLTLAAAYEGLGTCWIGAFKPEIVKKVLNLPQGVEPLAMTPLGYPSDKGVDKLRKPLSEVVHWEKW